MDPGAVQNIYLVIAFLVPGFIAFRVRAQFITGSSPSQKEAALSYLVLSIIYYAVAYPAIVYVFSSAEPSYLQWIALIFAGPALLGFLLGLNAQKEWGRRFIRWCHLNPVHAMPSAWDWKFGNTKEQWVLVTLKDGTELAGYCGAASFMSSDPGERDLYIQQVFEIAEDKTWRERTSAILITAGEIRTIEFWPIDHEGEQVEQHRSRDDCTGSLRNRAAGYKRISANSKRKRRIKAAGRTPANNRPRSARKSAKPGWRR